MRLEGEKEPAVGRLRGERALQTGNMGRYESPEVGQELDLLKELNKADVQ